MSKPITTNIPGFKVRIHMRSAVIHAFSTTLPVITMEEDSNKPKHIAITQDINSGYGDTIGFIDWSEVSGVTWKKTEEPRAGGRPEKLEAANVSAEFPPREAVRRDVIVPAIAQKFKVSERTVRDKVDALILDGGIIVHARTPREGGGKPIEWLRRNIQTSV